MNQEAPEKTASEELQSGDRSEAGSGAGQKNAPRKRSRIIANLVVIAAAAAVIIAVTVMPVLRVYGTSMQNTLNRGELVLALRTDRIEKGDLIAFYYNNNILIKRVIAESGDVVSIDSNGNVTVNGTELSEDYLGTKSYGYPDIEFPYTVPQDRLFVLGDNREVSVDSRSTSIGCVTSEQIVGKIVFRVWPITRFGLVR